MVIVSAADLVHAEDILHRDRTINGDPLIHRELCRVVASGRIDLAQSLLLSKACAPVRGPEGNCTTNGQNVGRNEEAVASSPEECRCGLPIDSRAAPDGSVGCLAGHATCPPHAADLLLSGGSCPACRIHLLYPRIPEAEARSTTELTEAELRRSRDRGDGGDESNDDSSREEGSVAVDDFVRIASDTVVCSEAQMAEPRSGGWSENMAESCGKVGRITKLIRES